MCLQLNTFQHGCIRLQFGSAIKQSWCDWLLNCLNSIWFWQRVSYCCSWMPFLIKDSQVVGSLFHWRVLNEWAAAASVLLTGQQAWLHQGHYIITRCTIGIISSIPQILIVILDREMQFSLYSYLDYKGLPIFIAMSLCFYYVPWQLWNTITTSSLV